MEKLNTGMRKDIVIATHNEGKMIEFRRMLEPLGFNVLSLRDIGLRPEAEENGTTFAENSLIKAHDIAGRAKGYAVIADDSGLEIHALDGFPGIRSARFMEGHPYSEKCKEIIHRLENKEDRSADFVSAVSLVSYDGEDHVFIGQTDGYITKEIKGEGGFGYDPIFFSPELNKTFGEATGEEKDKVSHRSRALRKLEDYIRLHPRTE